MANYKGAVGPRWPYTNNAILVQRFLRRLPAAGAGCTEWPGARLPMGYGYISEPMSNRKVYTHRLALEIHMGRAIPEGMHALHACDNPPCCRVGPGHVYLGTPKQNSEDMWIRGRAGMPKHAILTDACGFDGCDRPRAPHRHKGDAPPRWGRGSQLRYCYGHAKQIKRGQQLRPLCRRHNWAPGRPRKVS